MANPYREHAPGAALARWIECSWSVETPESLPEFPVRPDGCLDIIYSREGGLTAIGAMTAVREFTGKTPMSVFSNTGAGIPG
jgi:hypothetical protein